MMGREKADAGRLDAWMGGNPPQWRSRSHDYLLKFAVSAAEDLGVTACVSTWSGRGGAGRREGVALVGGDGAAGEFRLRALADNGDPNSAPTLVDVVQHVHDLKLLSHGLDRDLAADAGGQSELRLQRTEKLRWGWTFRATANPDEDAVFLLAEDCQAGDPPAAFGPAEPAALRDAFADACRDWELGKPVKVEAFWSGREGCGAVTRVETRPLLPNCPQRAHVRRTAADLLHQLLDAGPPALRGLEARDGGGCSISLDCGADVFTVRATKNLASGAPAQTEETSGRLKAAADFLTGWRRKPTGGSGPSP